MRSKNTIKIGKDTYIIGHWDVDKSTELFAWLMSSLGTSVKPVFQAISSKTNILDMQVSDIDFSVGVEVLDVVLKNIAGVVTPAEYSRRIGQILSDDVLCNNAPLDYKQHFRGRMKDMHQLVVAVLKFQYSDFLPDILSTFGASGQQKDSPLHSIPAN